MCYNTGGMNLKFSPHCQFRLYERGINIDHIKKAITAPDNKQDAFEGKIKVQKKIGQKIIKVIYYQDIFKDKKEEYHIITAYYL